MFILETPFYMIEDFCEWAAQYAPQWLIKLVFALVFIDALTWAFTL